MLVSVQWIASAQSIRRLLEKYYLDSKWKFKQQTQHRLFPLTVQARRNHGGLPTRACWRMEDHLRRKYKRLCYRDIFNE